MVGSIISWILWAIAGIMVLAALIFLAGLASGWVEYVRKVVRRVPANSERDRLGMRGTGVVTFTFTLALCPTMCIVGCYLMLRGLRTIGVLSIVLGVSVLALGRWFFLLAIDHTGGAHAHTRPESRRKSATGGGDAGGSAS